jgi:hypothetical protein
MAAFSKLAAVDIVPIKINWIDYFEDTSCLSKLKLPQLKAVAKYNTLRVSGTKPELLNRIIDHFNKIKSAIRIQTILRRNIVIRSIKSRGIGLTDRKKCVNDIDFYTLEPLSEICYADFFSYTDTAGFTYGFDLNSLNMMLNKQGKLINPYNREELDVPTRNIITKLIKMSESKTMPISDNEKMRNLITEARTKSDDVRIQELFYYIDHLGNYTQSSWFSELSIGRYRRLIVYLYELWRFKANMSNDVKSKICPYFNPFRDGLGETITPNGVQYAVLQDIDELRRTCLTVMENMIYTGVNDDFKRIGAMHVLTVLTHVSTEARTAIPWLYESVVF